MNVSSRADRVGIVVGIPSWNNARTIGHVVDCAVRGLSNHFPDAIGTVLNSDGGSVDGTPAAVAKAAEDVSRSLGGHRKRIPTVRSVPYRGIPGKGSAFRTIFEAAVESEAGAVVVLDADLRSVTPDWIQRLAAPILDGDADYVAPLYTRHRFDGTITNSIVYPLTSALYGGGIRQPIGGDFGFSGKLAAHFLSKEVWETDVARFGIDLWMTTTALADGFRLGQAHLGAKIHDPKDPGSDLSAMLAQVVGTAFGLMETYDSRWIATPPLPPVPVFGHPEPVAAPDIHVNVDRMESAFRSGLEHLEQVFDSILPRTLLDDLKKVAHVPGPIVFDEQLWTRTVLHFALAFHRRRLPREQLLRSLTPLYIGRTGSFVRRHTNSTDGEVEAALSVLENHFADRIPALKRLWTSSPEGGEQEMP